MIIHMPYLRLENDSRFNFLDFHSAKAFLFHIYIVDTPISVNGKSQ